MLQFFNEKQCLRTCVHFIVCLMVEFFLELNASYKAFFFNLSLVVLYSAAILFTRKLDCVKSIAFMLKYVFFYIYNSISTIVSKYF